MSTSFESEPERTELSTQSLPTIPAVEEMKTWDEKKVLQWIQQRDGDLLKGDNLNTFDNASIVGRTFLASSYDFFKKECGLSPGASLGLMDLVDEVKEGMFIP